MDACPRLLSTRPCSYWCPMVLVSVQIPQGISSYKSMTGRPDVLERELARKAMQMDERWEC